MNRVQFHFTKNKTKQNKKQNETNTCKLISRNNPLSLNPIQTGERGGGAIVPALTLEVYNFFHKQAKPTKPGHFS